MIETQDQRTANRNAANQLRELAVQLDAAANRADTLDREDTRRREAAQVRFVAVLVESCGCSELAEPWLSAAKKMVDAYDDFDMLAVHASRASRRVEPEAHADTIVNVSEATA